MWGREVSLCGNCGQPSDATWKRSIEPTEIANDLAPNGFDTLARGNFYLSTPNERFPEA